MAVKWKQCESLLTRMAESMGFTIVAVPATSFAGAAWYIAKQLESRRVFRLTVSYFSPAELLDKFLNYYCEFVNCPGLGQMTPNPFYGMSPEEAELRLAVIGA